MSEAVHNKVRPNKDNQIGFTMYWKYKANSVILLRSIEIMKMKCYNFFNMSNNLTLRGDEMYPRKADEL